MNFSGLANFATSGASGGWGKAAAGGGDALKKVFDFLGSKGGQTAVAGVGTALSDFNNSRNAGADRALSKEQFDANLRQRQLESDRSHALSQAEGAARANPIGTVQDYGQRNAILNAILPGLRNMSATPGDPMVASAKGSVTGGFRLPEGGFDPAMIARMFGDEATMASIGNHMRQVGQINPHTPVQDLAPMYGKAGADMSSAIMKSGQSELERQTAEEARKREIIMRAIDNDIRGTTQQPKRKNPLGSAASGAMTGASIGSIVPGIGTGIGAAVGGIGGFLKGLF